MENRQMKTMTSSIKRLKNGEFAVYVNGRRYPRWCNSDGTLGAPAKNSTLKTYDEASIYRWRLCASIERDGFMPIAK